MTTHQVIVENIKCAGCMSSIKTGLQRLPGVMAVEIRKEEDKICVTGVAVDRDAVVKKLAWMGYPEKGKNSLLNKAMSLVSCATGNINNGK